MRNGETMLLKQKENPLHSKSSHTQKTRTTSKTPKQRLNLRKESESCMNRGEKKTRKYLRMTSNWISIKFILSSNIFKMSICQRQIWTQRVLHFSGFWETFSGATLGSFSLPTRLLTLSSNP